MISLLLEEALYLSRVRFVAAVISISILALPSAAQSSQREASASLSPSKIGSPYVPVGNWVYPIFARLIAQGYIGSAYLGLRPWTRITCAELTREAEEVSEAKGSTADSERMIAALTAEFSVELRDLDGIRTSEIGLQSAYSRVTGISGSPVNDSYHFGQTIINDYGRPYEEGMNDIVGFSVRGQAGRFAVYSDGEFQHAPSAHAYPLSVREVIEKANSIPLPAPSPIASTDQFRLLDTYVSGNALGLDFSLGKQSLWWGPTETGPMAMSDNATPFWMFRIDRNDPFRIPLLSRITGPFRVDAFFGELAGHEFPRQSFIHAQKISFKPTPNLEFGFSRVVVFAGANHVPLTFDSFFHSFFSLQDVSATEKRSRRDPGARHSAFDASYRVPGLRNWLTIYTDSIAHGDVSPISAPRRAAISPGFYISHFPGIPKLDLRAEAVYTDPPSDPVAGGQFIYWESVYRDVYLNHGNLFGDWIGRDGKGYQAWLTYWRTPKTSFQLSYREAKVSPKFIPGGTTQNLVMGKADIWVHKNLEVTGSIQFERWAIPVLAPKADSDTTATVGVTFWPDRVLGWHKQ